MGNQSTNNQCVVSNGATLAVVANQGNLINGTYTLMTVTGGGTTCTFAGDLRFGGDSDVLAITSGGALVDTNGFAANNGDSGRHQFTLEEFRGFSFRGCHWRPAFHHERRNLARQQFLFWRVQQQYGARFRTGLALDEPGQSLYRQQRSE